MNTINKQIKVLCCEMSLIEYLKNIIVFMLFPFDDEINTEEILIEIKDILDVDQKIVEEVIVNLIRFKVWLIR